MFIPLRIHSVYSKGRGGGTLEELASWAKETGIPEAALTDTGNIYGWEKWVRLMQAAGVRPLLGCEIEVGGRSFLFLVKERQG